MSRRSVSSLLALARWENALIAGAGVLLGAWWSGWGPACPIALAVFGALALTVAANAWNDAADVEIDRLVHPDRPLPSGTLSVRHARGVSAGAALLGIALAAAADLALGALTLGVVVLMLAYSPWLKRTGLVGNLTVATLASLPFLYGSWSAGHGGGALPLVITAAPLHLAREIAKDLDDAPADAGARRTLPVVAGPTVALGVLVTALLAFVVLLLPFVALRPALGVVLAPALVLLAYGAALALRRRAGSPKCFKLAMLCAMAAFVVVRM